MQKRVVILIPYFGTVPTYFEYWLKTISYNSKFNFIFITDRCLSEMNIKIPNNMKVINISFTEFQKKVQNCFDFIISLSQPYKICDYRPAFFYIFKEYISDYDFWGWCDVDLLFGNMSKYLTDEVLEKCDKIFECGNLVLLRNSDKMNNLYKVKSKNAFDYKTVFTSLLSYHFDEYWGLSVLAKENKMRVLENNNLIADIKYKENDFVCFKEKERTIYMWENGNLYKITEDGKIEEILLVHFQKRDISCDLLKNKGIPNQFYLIPNRIVYDISEIKNPFKGNFILYKYIVTIKDYIKKYKLFLASNKKEYFLRRKRFKSFIKNC